MAAHRPPAIDDGRAPCTGRAPIVVLVAAVAVFVGLSVAQWGRPAIEDEALMQRAAYRWLAGAYDATGLCHTPLYMEMTTLWQRLVGAAAAGTGVAVMRSFGTLCGLATLVVFVRGARGASGGAVPWLMASVLAVHPFFVGATLLVDMDTAALPLFLLLWVVFVDRSDRAPGGSAPATLAAAAAFGLAMMTKELTPLVCLPVWIAYAALRGARRPGEPVRRHVVLAIAGCAAGAVVFLGLLAAWSALRGLPMSAPFARTFERLELGHGGPTGEPPWSRWGLARWAYLSYLPVVWLCVPAAVGVALALADGRRPKIRDLASAPLAWWFAAAVFAAYTWIGQAAYHFPKYTACALVAAAYGAAQKGAAWERRCASPGAFRWTATVWALLAVAVVPAFVPSLDPLWITEGRAAFVTRAAGAAAGAAVSPLGVVAEHCIALALPLAAIVALDVLRRRGRAPDAALAAAILLHCAATSAAHAARTHSVGYLYGESGFEAAVERVRSLRADAAADGELGVVSPFEDLAWALGPGAVVLERGDDLAAPSDAGRRILVSRTYGHRAVRENAAWRDAAARLYARHEVVDAPGGRFELWWNR